MFLLPSSKHFSKARWFWLHALTNVCVGTLSMDCLSTIHTNPIDFQVSSFPTQLAVSLHIYHCLFFKLSKEDIFHHVLFAAILGSVSLIYHHSSVVACLFFLNGYPGSIIYFLLACKKGNVFLQVDEPFVSMVTNLCFRMPGTVYVLFLFFPSLLRIPSSEIPVFVKCLQFVLPLFNSVFFTFQSIKRFVRNL